MAHLVQVTQEGAEGDNNNSDEWQCGVCSFYNAAGSDKCEMCDSMRHTKIDENANDNDSNNDIDHDIDHHDIDHHDNVDKYDNNNNNDNNNHNNNTMDSNNGWNCSQCTFLNDESMDKCQVCDAPKYQNTSPSTTEPQPWLTDDITIGLAANNKYDDLKIILQTKYKLTGADVIIQTQNMINLYHETQTPQNPPTPQIPPTPPTPETELKLKTDQIPPAQQESNIQQETVNGWKCEYCTFINHEAMTVCEQCLAQKPVGTKMAKTKLQIVSTHSNINEGQNEGQNEHEKHTKNVEMEMGKKLKRLSQMKTKIPFRHPNIVATAFLLSLGINGMGIILSAFCIIISMDLEEYYSAYKDNNCIIQYIPSDTVLTFGVVSYIVCVLSSISFIVGCCVLNIDGCSSKVVANIFYIGFLMINAIFMIWLFILCNYLDTNAFENIEKVCAQKDIDEIDRDFLTMYLFIIWLAAIVFCIIFGVLKGGYSKKMIGYCMC